MTNLGESWELCQAQSREFSIFELTTVVRRLVTGDERFPGQVDAGDEGSGREGRCTTFPLDKDHTPPGVISSTQPLKIHNA